MTNHHQLGGVIHTYQKYDPLHFPSPTQPPPDVASSAMEHMLLYGKRRKLTAEELARAVRLDPSQIAGLGPGLDALQAILEERKRKILARFETDTVQRSAAKHYQKSGQAINLPANLQKRFQTAFKEEQIRELEGLWYAAGGEQSGAAKHLLKLVERLAEKYQVDELAGKYNFTGRTSMTVPEALEIKEELEKIDKLLEQLNEARKTAQIGIIDLELLEEFTEPGDMERLGELRKMVEDLVKQYAEQQGLEADGDSFKLTPQAYRIFQGKLLQRIFSDLQAGKTGRHQGPVTGEGAVEIERTKEYEFGDSLAHMDIPQTLINTMLRSNGERPLRMKGEDIVIHHTRNTPKCATAVIMDMSGSMRHDGQYANVKRMALALDGLLRSEFPGDYLRFIEMFTLARVVPPGEIIELMAKPVTLFDPVVRYKIDMSREDVTESRIPPHFTNIQRSLQLARQMLSVQDTPNRQIILITDGLPTAHFQENFLYLLYPPDVLTEQATMREGQMCAREGITINIFLIPSWSQSEEDIRFAYRLAESTKGRVFFTAGKDLDRFVVWDYVQRKREILG